MKSKLVTAYWMDSEGYPYQGTLPVRKNRYLGSLISHCQGSELEVICYTHEKNFQEVLKIKNDYNLFNLEIKILELNEIKFHKRINEIREKKFDTDLDGRGPEIMWGKFDILEREIENYDRVYWVDVGLQHPGIFPWRYSKVYKELEPNWGIPYDWWANYDVHNFSKLINKEVYLKLNQICDKKIMFLTSVGPQISYPFLSYGILENNFESPYPVSGMIGGDTIILKKFLNYFWYFAKEVLNKNFLCVEEALMKPAYDMLSEDEKISFKFFQFASGTHDEFHFYDWEKNIDNPKPFYMIWKDILKYK